MKSESVIGMRFNKLVVVSEYSKNNVIYRHCICDCGKTTDTTLEKLRTGHTKSCGCIRKGINRKHGQSNTKLYSKWRSMFDRCTGTKGISYKNYGGRGIKVCDEWKTFDSFYKWAYENGYRDGLTLDRIDNNGNYEPSNCRWATVKEQSLNRRSNRRYEYSGVTKTISEWADEYGIKRGTLRERLEHGWSIEQALNTPLYAKRKVKNNE